MKKIIENLFFLVTFIFLFFLVLNRNNIKKTPSFDVDKLIHYENECDGNFQQLELEKININLNKIKSISVDNVEICLQRAKVSGKFFYEKENKKLRVLIGTFFGKEMDIGANQEYFWFWSKRMSPSALFYAEVEKADKTKLRTALSYSWIINSFGFECLCSNNSKIIKFNGLLALKEYLIINEEAFTCVSVINNDSILGKYLYQDTNILASIEYNNFKKIHGIKIPTKFDISWYEENIFMSWEFKEVCVNTEIKQEFWSMPDYNPKINISF